MNSNWGWKNVKTIWQRCVSLILRYLTTIWKSGWEHHLLEAQKALDVWMSELIVKYLYLMPENLNFYFTDSENEWLTSNMWVLHPFSNDGANDSNILLELEVDYCQKAAFQTFGLLDFPVSRSRGRASWASNSHVCADANIVFMWAGFLRLSFNQDKEKECHFEFWTLDVLTRA